MNDDVLCNNSAETINVNGDVKIISNGEYTARISTVGAALLSLESKSRGQLCYRLSDDCFSDAYVGKVIAPWSNRVAGGEYSVEGKNYFLPINEISSNCALHGLVAWSKFDVEYLEKDCVVLSYVIFPSPAYPFTVKITVKYYFDDCLCVKIVARNFSAKLAPVDLCFHPYVLPASADSVDECKLVVYGNSGSGETVVYEQNMNDVSIDSAFEVGGSWRAELSCKGDVVVLSGTCEYLHLYSGESVNRKAMAIEPCTVAPDSFGETKGGHILAPEQSISIQMRIS